MTYNYLYQKYKNLNLKEDLINGYSYSHPISLKYKLKLNFKKPKLFPINRNVEDFESFESGSKKTLKEFQNLYMHRFSDINSYRNTLKKSLDSSTLKQKLEKKYKMINNNSKNKIKEDSYNSLMKIVKSNNKENQSKRGHLKLYILPKNSLNNIKRFSFNIPKENKCLSRRLLKKENDIEKTPEKKKIKFFKVESKLSLLEQISNKIIKSNEKYNSNNNSIRLINLKKKLNFEEYKNCFEPNIQSYFINKNKNMRYYELTKKGLNFSDSLIVEKKKYPNSKKKKKKIERKISYEYLNSIKRPLSSLEKYFIKFGVFP